MGKMDESNLEEQQREKIECSTKELAKSVDKIIVGLKRTSSALTKVAKAAGSITVPYPARTIYMQVVEWQTYKRELQREIKAVLNNDIVT
jgi:hypothetical protein